jgi:UDP-glucose 4-epimerase
MVKMLHQKGHLPVTFDNLSTGYRDAVKYGEFVLGDINDSVALDQLFTTFDFDAVMHFASYIEVGESVVDPSKYYRNNFSNTLNLLDAMIRHGVDKFIFSSTAVIFGEPEYTPIDENHPHLPINPYGMSKLMVERALEDYDRAYGLKSVCLRYFNAAAAAADPEGELGERHQPETHLIPLVLQAASGRREAISIFGQDYETDDGSCVRDYIHINDLCEAHLLAINSLINGSDSKRYNLGNGNGYSVRAVIDEVKNITGRQFEVIEALRRQGDPAILVANSDLAKKELNRKTQYHEISRIIEHAWRWESSFFAESQ